MKPIIVTLLVALVSTFIPRVPPLTPASEATKLPKAYAKVADTKLGTQKPLDGFYLVLNTDWHYDCRSQENLVHEAVDALGMSKDWTYISYIFANESCFDPGRLNSIGARGLGQSLGHADFTCGPGDIPCQLHWFATYSQKYGGWYGSYIYWQNHRLW